MMPTAMNMPVAQMGDTELRVLSDSELDDVNGGLIVFAVAAYWVAVGFAIGFSATRAYLENR